MGKNVLETVPTDINYQLTADLMGDLSDKEDTSELLAIVKMREDSFSQFKFSDQPLVALLDRPSNRGNLGTIIRSCDGFGIDGLIITGHAVDLYDPEVIVSSMGSFFSVPVIRLTCNNQLLEFIADMKGKYPGFKVVGSTSHSQNSIHHCDLTAPLLLMIGNETDGLNRTFRELCDELVTIPMAESSSASSFNVGCAATVMFYEAIRQRTRFSEDF